MSEIVTSTQFAESTVLQHTTHSLELDTSWCVPVVVQRLHSLSRSAVSSGLLLLWAEPCLTVAMQPVQRLSICESKSCFLRSIPTELTAAAALTVLQ